LSCELIRREKTKMRKLLKSKKALSPVVAAIILIAVTVAVSIAVAAWMGSLTMNFMETKELTITQMTFVEGTANGTITVSVTNSGTSEVTVALVKVNGATMTEGTGEDSWAISPDTPVAAGGTATLTITTTISNGNKYAVNLFTSEGTLVGSYTDTA
jgi:flagellin-like protein